MKHKVLFIVVSLFVITAFADMFTAYANDFTGEANPILMPFDSTGKYIVTAVLKCFEVGLVLFLVFYGARTKRVVTDFRIYLLMSILVFAAFFQGVGAYTNINVIQTTEEMRVEWQEKSPELDVTTEDVQHYINDIQDPNALTRLYYLLSFALFILPVGFGCISFKVYEKSRGWFKNERKKI